MIFWAIKIETLFTSLNVLELIKEGYEDPEEQLEELKNNHWCWSFRDDPKRSIDVIFSRILRAKKSKEAWDILQQEFVGDTKVEIVKLPRDFGNTNG